MDWYKPKGHYMKAFPLGCKSLELEIARFFPSGKTRIINCKQKASGAA